MSLEIKDPISMAFEPIRPRKKPLWYKVLALVGVFLLLFLSIRASIYAFRYQKKIRMEKQQSYPSEVNKSSISFILATGNG